MTWLTGLMRRLAHKQTVSLTAPLAEASVASDINDYEPASDALVCIWDDAQSQLAPELKIMPDPDHTGRIRICLGKRTVAKVSGSSALTSADVTVMPLSSARAIGLENLQGALQ